MVQGGVTQLLSRLVPLKSLQRELYIQNSSKLWQKVFIANSQIFLPYVID